MKNLFKKFLVAVLSVTMVISMFSTTAMGGRSFTITYKDMGGAAFSGTHLGAAPTTYNGGDSYVFLMEAEKEGYYFAGWYDNSKCTGERIEEYKILDSSGDLTFYAKWEKAKPTLFAMAGSKLNDNVIQLMWNKVPGATKYVVYGNFYKNGVKKFATVTKNSLTVKKIGTTKIKAHKLYKFVVVAYTPNGKVTSKIIYHLAGMTFRKYSNAIEINFDLDPSFLLGQTHKFSVTYKTYKNMKHISKTVGAPIRFFSDNVRVAKVDANGNVRAVGEGHATIYAQDIGGSYVSYPVHVMKPLR